MSEGIGERTRALAETLTGWRRTLHERPELGFEERETAAFVAAVLRDMGLAVETGIAIVREASSESGNGVRAATILRAERARLDRDVVFCFQPGEEGFGGAEAMIAEGVLERYSIAEAYGLHLWSLFPVGTIQLRPGPTMAGNDEFRARFRGRGGHGALPHRAVDPIVAAAHGVVALQTVVARSVDPVRPSVVTVGALQAGSAPNVIPDEATLRGTMRSFDDAVRTLLRERVRDVLAGTAAAHGCALEFDLMPGYPAVVNDPAATERVRRHAAAVVGEPNVIEPDPMAAAEDFAYFLRKVPGAFAFVGAGNVERGIDAPHHAPRFDIDEAALPIGAELLARVALG